MTLPSPRPIILLVILAAALLAGCAGLAPEPTPTVLPSPTPEPLQRPSGAGGGLVVFASDRTGNQMDLFLINGDGTELTQLTDTARDELAPA